MSSRWMLQVQARNKAYRRRRGNESLTDREIKHGKQKIIPLDNGGILIEPFETFLARIFEEARTERINPSEWWRRLARVVQQIPGPLDAIEWKLVKRSAATGIWEKGLQVREPEPVERLIARIRLYRLNHPKDPPKTKAELAELRRKRGRIKPTKSLPGLKFPVFIIPDEEAP